MSNKQSPHIKVDPGNSSSLTSSTPPPRAHEGRLLVDLDTEGEIQDKLLEELRSPGKKK